MKFMFGLAMLAALGCANLAAAQEAAPAAAVPAPTALPPAEPQTAQPSPAAAPVAETAAAPAPTIPPGHSVAKAGSPVLIQIARDLSSKGLKQGDLFPIVLGQAITTDEGVLVPAGTPGFGQVVSASPSGAFGKAGELVLAARYLEFEGQKIPLKAFKLGGSGKNNSTELTVASMIAPLPIAIALLAVRGGNIDIPQGSIGNAKLAADVTLPVQKLASTPTPPAAEPAPTSDQPASEHQ